VFDVSNVMHANLMVKIEKEQFQNTNSQKVDQLLFITLLLKIDNKD
jgi:hypothetical protein